jgi:hypothetical protein
MFSASIGFIHSSQSSVPTNYVSKQNELLLWVNLWVFGRSAVFPARWLNAGFASLFLCHFAISFRVVLSVFVCE